MFQPFYCLWAPTLPSWIIKKAFCEGLPPLSANGPARSPLQLNRAHCSWGTECWTPQSGTWFFPLSCDYLCPYVLLVILEAEQCILLLGDRVWFPQSDLWSLTVWIKFNVHSWLKCLLWGWSFGSVVLLLPSLAPCASVCAQLDLENWHSLC